MNQGSIMAINHCHYICRTGIALGLFFGLATVLSAAGPGQVDYNFQVRPLLSDRCFTCHGPDEKARKKKLRLDQRDGMFKALDDDYCVVKPGDTNHSELVLRITTTNRDDMMPPVDSHLKLTAAEKDLLIRWVAQGAEFKPHWSLIPVGKVSPPQPDNKTWARNPIDAFVLAKLEAEQLSPAPEASREVLLRRLAFDLTGLPPTVTELDAFLADTSTNAYESAVDRYLGSPAYGERMAQDWLDLARFADTYGYQQDVERDMSPWRDWVIKSFNENLPYDQFLVWQLAGDLLPNATRDQRLATAFNRLHRQTNEGGSIDEEFRNEYAVDRVNTVGTAMLGFTIGCARCHDHKYDPIKQRDYYSLSAFFNNIDESGTYSHFTQATPTPTLLLWPENKSAEAVALSNKIAAVENRIETIRHEAAEPFQSWLKSGGKISAPKPVAHFAFDTVVGNNSPDSLSTNMAKLEDGPLQVAAGVPPAVEPGFQPGGKNTSNGEAPIETNGSVNSIAIPGGKMPPSTAGGTPAATNFALQFSGDNQAVIKGVGNFTRADTFSFSLWLKPAERQDRAVVLHHSRAWADSGSRGYELVLDHGKPFFGLIHFWPGNAIAVRAKQALPRNEWSQIVVTYDGSSRAAGIQLYLNGVPLETEVVRDHLYKDIVHRKEWGDMEVGKINLTLAGRFRDSGFKNGLIDDLQVFDFALTAAEVSLPAKTNDSAASLHYFLTRQYEPYQVAQAELIRIRAQENALFNDIPETMTMQELPQPRPSFVLKRGSYDAPGDLVERDTPASILAFPTNAPRNRLGLAEWMVDRQNPLTARVVVNRIWKMHFGRGIVATPDDFGSQGKLPTHPELLEWLAGWFMDNGWDVKALHRLIVNSATYRQSSQAPHELVERDPFNLLLARGPQQRLQAEQIRDSALAASGLLNRTIGGPSVKPYQPSGLWEAAGTGAKYTQDKGDKLYRRSLYTFVKRTSPPPSLLTFDATSREVCTAKRETTTTPLQALVLMNDPQFFEASRVLGQRLLKTFPGDENAQIREAFRELTGRLPDKGETVILRRLFAEQKEFYAKETGEADKLLATGESKRDESLPRADSAATTMLVNTIMNFDEFVMER